MFRVFLLTEKGLSQMPKSPKSTVRVFLVDTNFLLHVLIFRPGHAAHRGKLLQEREGEQGGLGRLHQDDQEEHKPERQGCCHHGCLKGLSLLSSLNFEIKNYFHESRIIVRIIVKRFI